VVTPNAPTIPGYVDFVEVGRGGFATVYRARDERFARDVAIKVLSGGLDDAALHRFARECAAAGRLSGHPAIVSTYASGTTDDGRPYLVMEFLSGGSLTARLAAGPLSPDVAVALGVTLAGALETAHRAGVFHRDVKPENVMFSAYDEPKLVDFGIATVRGGYETRSAAITASIAHAAPEIIDGAAATAASDVYALASTLYQSLSGRPAFFVPGDETLLPMAVRIARDPVPDLRPLGVPAAVADVIEHAMSKSPADRPASAAAFGAALQAAMPSSRAVMAVLPIAGVAPAEQPVEAGVTTTVGRRAERTPAPVAPVPVEPRRRWLVATVAGTSIAAVLGVLMVLVVVGAGSKGSPSKTAAGGPTPAAVTSTSTASAKPQPAATTTKKAKPAPRRSTSSPAPAPAGPTGGTTTNPTTGGGGSTPAAPRVTKPGAPADVRSYGVVVVARDSKGDPTKVRVSISWARGSGGAPTRYCVRSILMKNSSTYGSPVSRGCTTGTSLEVTMAADETASSWLRWQASAANTAGTSAWASGLAVVPNCVGQSSPDAFQKLRVGGLEPNPQSAGAPPSAGQAGQVIQQSPTSGVTAAGTLIYIKFYEFT
jgi:hypothetical protein